MVMRDMTSNIKGHIEPSPGGVCIASARCDKDQCQRTGQCISKCAEHVSSFAPPYTSAVDQAAVYVGGEHFTRAALGRPVGPCLFFSRMFLPSAIVFTPSRPTS